MNNYKNMTNEEIKKQLEWSDSHEFSYDYSMWAFEEIERLNNIINELEKWIKENNLGKYRTENVIDTDELLDKLQELKGSDK